MYQSRYEWIHRQCGEIERNSSDIRFVKGEGLDPLSNGIGIKELIQKRGQLPFESPGVIKQLSVLC